MIGARKSNLCVRTQGVHRPMFATCIDICVYVYVYVYVYVEKRAFYGGMSRVIGLKV